MRGQGLKTTLMGAALILAVVSTAAFADAPARPSYTKDVLPILQTDCQLCHRPLGQNVSGMIAPMSLMTYQEVRPWAKSIAKTVQTRTMPPWKAAPEFTGQFKHERVLTEDEIATFVNWAKTGAQKGKAGDAPPPIEWPESGWTIGDGTPDLIVEFDEPNWVNDDIDDLYQNITVRLTEDQMPEDRWLKAIEFKPGSEAVHHIIAYQTAPSGSGAMTGGMLGGEAPGTDPTSWEEGFGVLVPKTPIITFQMHYHKESGPGTGVWDNSSFAMVFHDEDDAPVTHAVQIASISHGAFEIPPRHKNWKVAGAQTFRRDTLILGFMPHLHLRGVACKYTARYPDGTSEVLLDVPRYDFNWQIFYEYKKDKMKEIPAGTRVEFEMWFDNSPERGALLGINADRPVAFGGPTWDEMDLGWMNYTNVEPMRQDSGD